MDKVKKALQSHLHQTTGWGWSTLRGKVSDQTNLPGGCHTPHYLMMGPLTCQPYVKQEQLQKSRDNLKRVAGVPIESRPTIRQTATESLRCAEHTAKGTQGEQTTPASTERRRCTARRGTHVRHYRQGPAPRRPRRSCLPSTPTGFPCARHLLRRQRAVRHQGLARELKRRAPVKTLQKLGAEPPNPEI